MLKAYITILDSKENGSAITIFEDALFNFVDAEQLRLNTKLTSQLADKIEEVEKINNETTRPF